MISTENNALLCDVEPGRPMHELLRRYWLPAGLSDDLPQADSDPVRITLLSRNYVMFRDSAGQVGVLDEACAHRCASLALGRVEEGGIRCIYHGWKFDRSGRVIDQPNVADQALAQTFRQPAYAVREAGGFVWVYLGPPDNEPPFPHYPWFDAPAHLRFIGAPLINCNFVQVMEGGIDSAHLGVLHSDAHSRGVRSAVADRPIVGTERNQFVRVAAPRIEVGDTEWGFRYAALRDITDPDGTPRTQVRVTTFCFPFCVNVANDGSMLMAMPLTTDWTVHYHVFWSLDAVNGAARLAELTRFLGWSDAALQARHRARLLMDISGTVNARNGYRQDRAGMRDGTTFSGIPNVTLEDVAVTESMGAVSDRTLEHLVPSDAAVVRARRLLIENARRVQQGEEPLGLRRTQPPSAGEGYHTPEHPWRSWFDDWKRVEPAGQ